MNAPKLLLALAGALGVAAIAPSPASAGKGVLVRIDNRMNQAVTCDVHRKDNHASLTPSYWRSVKAKSKVGYVFLAPDTDTEVYLKCGPSGEQKRMRLNFNTSKAKTHYISVGCYNAGGCIANQRVKPKSSGGRA